MRDPNSWDIPDPPVIGSNRIYAVSFVGQFDERPGYQARAALFTSSKFHYILKPFIIAPTKKEHGSIIKKALLCAFVSPTGILIDVVEIKKQYSVD